MSNELSGSFVPFKACISLDGELREVALFGEVVGRSSRAFDGQNKPGLH